MIVVKQSQEEKEEVCQAVVRFNPTLEKLKSELDEVKSNKLNHATRVQYLSGNTAFIIFLFENYPEVLIPHFLESYKSVKEVDEKKLFVKFVKESLEMSRVCPIDIKAFKVEVFMTYLLSLKRSDGIFFSYSCYDGKRSALVHLFSESGIVFDMKSKIELSDMMVGFKKSIAKENS